jgi:nitrilase
MSDVPTPFLVAAVQAAPIFLDREATIEKACDLITEAATGGARIVVFPEAFVPAYPDWVWALPGGKRALHDELYSELVASSVTIPDRATEKLADAAKKTKVYVAIGVNERNTEGSGASLYNTILYLGPTGEVLGRHRKLIPTGGERLVWAPGDGSTLVAFDTPYGKLGGLVCWENYMPLARSVLYAWGTQIYVALTWDQSETWLNAMRHIGHEGGMYVISCCTALPMDAIPDEYEFKKFYPEGREWVNRGNSCIVGPRGELLAGPVEAKEEILYAEVDLSRVLAAKRMFDVAGHYSRPDVFDLTLNRRANRPLNVRDPKEDQT